MKRSILAVALSLATFAVHAETDREYIERVHSYAHGNTLGLADVDRREKLDRIDIDRLGRTSNEYGQRLDGLDAGMVAIDGRFDSYGAQLNSARRDALEAKRGASAALAVAGQQFNTDPDAGFQMAVSAATLAGEQAVAVGAGGAVSERLFLNAAFTQSGSTRGGVVSATYSFK